MAWQGIWFEPEACEGGGRDPAHLRALHPPIVYPYAHAFVNAEADRVRRSRDPGSLWKDRETRRVWYSLAHDSRETGVGDQGCRIVRWLFESFDPDSRATLAARLSEIPIVIHADSPAKAAAMANALALIRFLTADEDQAIARIAIVPWGIGRLGPERSATAYEERVREFLGGSIFYPEGVTLFDVLGRADLRCHRELAACCTTQIGFVRSLLDWVDEERPKDRRAELALEARLRRSLADEARFLREGA